MFSSPYKHILENQKRMSSDSTFPSGISFVVHICHFHPHWIVFAQLTINLSSFPQTSVKLFPAISFTLLKAVDIFQSLYHVAPLIISLLLFLFIWLPDALHPQLRWCLALSTFPSLPPAPFPGSSSKAFSQRLLPTCVCTLYCWLPQLFIYGWLINLYV